MNRIYTWLTALTLSAAVPAFGQTTNPPPPVPATDPDFPRGRISGLIFGDYYYNVTGEPTHTYNATGSDADFVNIDGSTFPSGQPRVIGRDLNGTQIRRVYFQLDNDLSIRVSSRFRLEADSKELTSGGKLGVFVKAAYVQIKDLVPRGNFLFGMVNTPTFESSEEFWAYRAVEKTLADFRGIASSSDVGVQLRGFVDDGHRIGYNALLGDGTGQKPEDNRYKRAYFSLPLRPLEDLRIEPYVDYEGFTGGNNRDRVTYKIFSGYEFRRAAVGAEVVDRINHVQVGRNAEPFGFSVFGRMKAADKLGAFARYDRWQPNTRAANRIDQNLYIAGLDWEPYKDVHVMPNVEMAQYSARGTATAPAHHDLQARVTFYWKFSKP
jgi:hypothetical protein